VPRVAALTRSRPLPPTQELLVVKGMLKLHYETVDTLSTTFVHERLCVRTPA